MTAHDPGGKVRQPETTPLYARTMAFNYGDDERCALMRKVWAPTPWMITVDTGPIDAPLWREIANWCFDTFGDECFPIHERTGVWQRGCATVFGETWFGFATETAMRQFIGRWLDRVKADPHPTDTQGNG